MKAAIFNINFNLEINFILKGEEERISFMKLFFKNEDEKLYSLKALF